MILFYEDWERFPSAIIDMQTTNTSFLRHAALLREMGVKNWGFCLQLFQPELVGVDPYSENLTREQKDMIAMECHYNAWYFIREIVRIPPIAGIDPVKFKINRANCSLLWAFLNHIDYLLIQPRQTGKSVSTDAITSWLYLFAMVNSKMLLITKDDSLRSENVIRLRNIRGYLPKWLVYEDKTDANNTTMVTYNTNNNIYRTAVGQNSEDAALKIGRGSTVPFMHCDEGPFIPYFDVTFPAAASAMNAAKDEAKLNHLPYGVIMTTTAGKIDSRSGRYFYEEIYTKGCVWDEAYYDLKDHEELIKVLKANGGNVVGTGKFAGCKVRNASITGVFSHRQLGYTDQWLYEKMIESKSRGEDADRDYLNIWTSGGLSSPLTNAQNAAILNSEKPHEWIDIDPETGFILKWFIPKAEAAAFVAKNHIVFGVDTSDAIGRDDIAIVGTSQTDLSVVCTATINESNLIVAAQWLAGVLVKYQNSTMVIEKKSSAQTFIDAAITILHHAGQDPFRRIYNRIVDNPGDHKAQMEEIRNTPVMRRKESFYLPFRKYFGFNTTGDSRTLLYSQVLINAVKHAGPFVHDSVLSTELRCLEMRNNRIDHKASGHDDMVIAWLLGHWFYMFGRQLDYYGIDTRRMMLRVGKDGGVATPEEIQAKEYQEVLRLQIEALSEKLKSTQDPNILIVIEQQLRKLQSQVTDNTVSLSIDGAIREARDARKAKAQQRRRQNPYPKEKIYGRAFA